jgi:antitoxin (DNA-binding transcriptional repressor) of toxin-antitoxin stability system
MELSMREAKTRFVEARGERVVVTKDGRPFAGKGPAQRAAGMDFPKAALVRRALVIDGLSVGLPADFDDPGFSRRVLGLDP